MSTKSGTKSTLEDIDIVRYEDRFREQSMEVLRRGVFSNEMVCIGTEGNLAPQAQRDLEQLCLHETDGTNQPTRSWTTILTTIDEQTMYPPVAEPKMIFRVFSFFYFLTRPLLKWFLHRFTNLCELQRICYGCPPGATRTKKVQLSLELSKRVPIKKLLHILNELVSNDVDESFLRREIQTRAVGTVLQVKKINPKVHIDFPRSFGSCAEKIWGYKRLFYMVEKLRATQYDSEEPEHEAKLLALWQLLVGDEMRLTGRISDQWQHIGFQGDDPMTDFRGMGILGLDNLLYLTQHYNGTARHLLSHSHHPHHGYFFAIVGINLTSMAYHLLKSGVARTHFYNHPAHHLTVDAFHQFYCYLFYEFDRYWVECKPKSIMDFNLIQRRFEENIVKLLAQDGCFLKMNLAVENI